MAVFVSRNELLDRLLAHTLTVYPRVCGETLVEHEEFPQLIGLSPRVRGNP